MTNNPDHHAYEAVIVGGGLTGIMMAIALSYGGYGSSDAPRIALIDRAFAPSASADNLPDQRTTTIHAAGKIMLETLGVWQNLNTVSRIAPTPISRIRVANGAPPQGDLAKRNQPDFRLDWQDDTAPMAYVVANNDLLNALHSVLKTRPVTCYYDMDVTGFDADGVDGSGDFAQLHFTSSAANSANSRAQSSLSCQLVVACDGAHSRLRQMAGMRHHAQTHRQTAIVTNLIIERDHNDTAFQRFLDTGPLAFMPHGNRRVSLVWTLPKERATQLAALDDAAFALAVFTAFGDNLGGISCAGPRHLWPLIPATTSRMTSNRLILAGDASHAIHPLAGQGYNLALGDAAVLADCFARASARGLTAGHRSIQSDYQAGRTIEVSAMSAVTSGLNHLMSYQPKIAAIAGAGMRLANASPAKDMLQKSASGGHLTRASLFNGQLPRA